MGSEFVFSSSEYEIEVLSVIVWTADTFMGILIGGNLSIVLYFFVCLVT